MRGRIVPPEGRRVRVAALRCRRIRFEPPGDSGRESKSNRSSIINETVYRIASSTAVSLRNEMPQRKRPGVVARSPRFAVGEKVCIA